MHRHESPPGREQPESALELVRSADRFVLVGHERPDGDCAGSQAALASALESLGKQVWIVTPDPLPASLRHLALRRRFAQYRGGDLPRHDVTVALDFCDLTRCGSLAAALRAAPSRKLLIDHHPCDVEPWWDAAYVDTAASSTGLLVQRLARELGARLDADGAVAAFTAMVTDTGWFRYSNTDAETLAAAAELVAGGVQPAEVYRAVYQRCEAERPLGIARALSQLRYHADGRLAVVDLPRPAPGEPDLAEGDEVLDLLRAVGSVEVALFLRETASGAVRLSARSRGEHDVRPLAIAFGGGGHAKAAGATLEGPLESARTRVVAAAVRALETAEAHSA